LPIEDQELDNLHPGSREMERDRSEGQNFQLKEVQRLEEEKEKEENIFVANINNTIFLLESTTSYMFRPC
jgi:hypothetical protein